MNIGWVLVPKETVINKDTKNLPVIGDKEKYSLYFSQEIATKALNSVKKEEEREKYKVIPVVVILNVILPPEKSNIITPVEKKLVDQTGKVVKHKKEESK